MNSGPGFDVAAHDFDGLLKGSSSLESMANGGAQGVPSPTSAHQQQQQQPPATQSPPSVPVQYQQQQQQQQYQQQQMSEQAIPAATSPPTMAPIPRGPTFMGTSGVSEVKLKRFLEHNQRLREHLEMRRIPVSEASDSLIQFVTTTRDALIPSLWGTTGTDPFAKQSTGCCNIS